ncbi:hypothetical protein Tco_0868989, partial [Tanacetum coccineum]
MPNVTTTKPDVTNSCKLLPEFCGRSRLAGIFAAAVAASLLTQQTRQKKPLLSRWEKPPSRWPVTFAAIAIGISLPEYAVASELCFFLIFVAKGPNLVEDPYDSPRLKFLTSGRSIDPQVNNLERFIENLCTIWIGSFHLHANTVHFNREPRQMGMFNNSNVNQNNGKGNFSNTMSVGNSKGSFASILKEGVHQQPVTTTPTLVLDDSCLKDHDFSSSLMCQVKDVTAIPNLHIILSEEGFQSIHITYPGGLWVIIKFESFDVLEKFRKHVGISSWFSSIKPPINSFVSNERIVWISIEEMFLSRKHLCLKTKVHEIINESLKVIIKGVAYWIRAKELDAWVPKFLNESDNSSSKDDFYDSDEGNKDDDEEINIKQDDIEDEHVSVTSDMHEKGTSNDKEVEHVSETCDMQQEEPINDKDTSNPKGDNSQSSDPFNIYKLLRKKENKHHHSKDSGPSHPPGFTLEFVSVNKEEGS